MKDRYLSAQHQLARLRADYAKHKSLIIAVDFDNTIYDFHGAGDTYPELINLLKQCYQLGLTIIIFTSNKDHAFIKNYINSLPFRIYGINKSPVTTCGTAEKPYFNILLDDRAGLESAYNTLLALVEELQNDKS